MLCISPVSLPRPDGNGPADRIAVPCGKCIGCLSRRRNEWSFRLEQEQKCSDYSFFITLTYNDENLKFNSSGHPVVCKRDVQLFFKRLRRCSSGIKYRYFLVAEYGPTTLRPHYHCILFATCDRHPSVQRRISENIGRAWCNPDTDEPIGFVHIGQCTPQSITYCAKYCLSKYDDDYAHLEPVFSLMSTKPGIGFNYVERCKEWHAGGDPKLYVINSSGYKMPLPRYYRSHIFSPDFVAPSFFPKFPDNVELSDLYLRAYEYGLRVKERSKLKSKI